ncbi:hypothetical protein [Catalinimonas niigatensis]|uniref:hypothetical protein n=1 Tax=Catalinimonas niigatensis TaxID=1397264 RepID=UPI0026660495|nr:hypothetical protein [Catalinimonas niigatensis]WPP49127.1 hypothetical protein PZB72_20890 [Catalinimonas niigatensis]
MNINKSNIKRRLVKYVADLWGYQQADMDGFDPLVDLLLGACAVEFERTGNQIISSQSRVLEKLAYLLLPESLVTPLPAHTVIHASSVEPLYTLRPEDQFSVDKEVVNPVKPTEISKKAVFFSPTLPANIFDASIRYVGIGKRLLQQLDINTRETLGSTKKGESFANQSIWLGLKVSPNLTKVPQLSFFFDWRNHPEKQKYLNLIPVTQCLVGEYSIPSRSGYGLAVEDKVGKQRNELVEEWDILPKIEDKVNQLYEQHFLTLSGSDVTIKSQLQVYPEGFAELFEEEILKNFKEPLLWIELSLSQLIPQEAIEEMTIAINCFPACNRQLIDNRRPYRLDESLNIIPLKSEDYFLAVHKVASGDNQPFQGLPFFDIKQMKPGIYAIRKERVGKFDSRNAREMLQYILELMRDETAAFKAASGAIGSKEIVELEQILNRIENNLTKKASGGDTDQYLMLKPDKAKDIYVSFWNTTGAFANKIPAGSAFKTRTIDIKSNSVFCMTTSFGGKDKPSEQEKLYTFRSNLLSRDRIVTREDIRAACYAELGDTIAHIDIKKGYINAPSHRQGLLRVLRVEVTPNDKEELSEEEWNKICEELAMNLQRRSSIFLPITVKIVSPAFS